MSRPFRPALIALAAGTVTVAGLALLTTSASAVSPDVVISEVYGGGGNSGATLENDFIELCGYDIVHVNAEFSDQISDHDPQVVRLGGRGG